MARRKAKRNETLYQHWLRGKSIKALQTEFRISRQRIYQILKDRGVGEKEKVMRVVNRLSR